MQTTIVDLQNGMKLHYLKTEKFKTNIIGLVVRTNLDRDTVTKNALLSQVLAQGSKAYPNRLMMARQMETLYGSIFDSMIVKKGGEQLLYLYMETIHQPLGGEPLFAEGARFLYSILMEPNTAKNAFLPEIVEREKKRLSAKIKGRMDNKKEYAKIRCLEEMFAGEPFGIYADGYDEELDKIDAESLYHHYRKLIETAPIEILVAGNETADLEELKKLFSFQRGKISKTTAICHAKHRKEPIEKTETMEILQGKLAMGFSTELEPVGQAFYAMLVYNELFGGSASSRLFMKVREENSLCYYINTYVFRFVMSIFLQAGIDHKDKDKAIDLIKECLLEMQENPVAEEELKQAKEAIIKGYDSTADYQSGLIDFYMTQYFIGDKSGIKEFIEGIKNVSIKDVQEIAKQVKLSAIYFLTGQEESK